MKAQEISHDFFFWSLRVVLRNSGTAGTLTIVYKASSKFYIFSNGSQQVFLNDTVT